MLGQLRKYGWIKPIRHGVPELRGINLGVRFPKIFNLSWLRNYTSDANMF